MGTTPWKQASEHAITTTLQEKIREGFAFVATYTTPDASPIADNASLFALVQTGSRVISFITRVTAGGDAELLLHRNVTVSNAGAAMILANLNQNSNILPETVVTHTPTITNGGFPIYHIYLPGQIFGTDALLLRDTRWILKPNSIYAVELINREGSAAAGSFEFVWWREED